MENKCPSCGSELEYDLNVDRLFCNRCCMYYAMEQINPTIFVQQEKVEIKLDNAVTYIENPFDTAYEEKKVYGCNRCSAKFIIDSIESDSAFNNKCVLCGEKSLEYIGNQQCVKPKYYIPFKHNEKSIRKKVKRKLFWNILGSLKNRKSKMIVRGVYIPYKVHEITYNPTFFRSEKNVWNTKISEYDVEFGLEGMSLCMSEKFDVLHGCSIKDYETREMQLYNEQDVAKHYIACDYINSDYARRIIHNRCRRANEQYALDGIGPDYIICQYDKNLKYIPPNHSGTISRSIDYESEKVQCTNYSYVLIPVWAVEKEYNGKTHMLIVGDNNGKIFTELPGKKDRLISAFLVSIFLGLIFNEFVWSVLELLEISVGGAIVWLLGIFTVICICFYNALKLQQNIRVFEFYSSEVARLEK